MSYRVVYGETMPAWEQTFPTMREAKAFAKKHEGFGDRIFSIAKTIPGDQRGVDLDLSDYVEAGAGVLK